MVIVMVMVKSISSTNGFRSPPLSATLVPKRRGMIWGLGTNWERETRRCASEEEGESLEHRKKPRTENTDNGASSYRFNERQSGGFCGVLQNRGSCRTMFFHDHQRYFQRTVQYTHLGAHSTARSRRGVKHTMENLRMSWLRRESRARNAGRKHGVCKDVKCCPK